MKIEKAARRLAVTLAIAGVTLGTATTGASAAPASAKDYVQNGPSYVIDGPGARNGNGPHAFIVNGDGSREPVFFCDTDKPKKQHNKCVVEPVPGGDRF
jgi:hypothetical protein